MLHCYSLILPKQKKTMQVFVPRPENKQTSQSKLAESKIHDRLVQNQHNKCNSADTECKVHVNITNVYFTV